MRPSAEGAASLPAPLQRLPLGVIELVKQSPVPALDGSVLIGSQHTSVFFIDATSGRRLRWGSRSTAILIDVMLCILCRFAVCCIACQLVLQDTPRLAWRLGSFRCCHDRYVVLRKGILAQSSVARKIADLFLEQCAALHACRPRSLGGDRPGQRRNHRPKRLPPAIRAPAGALLYALQTTLAALGMNCTFMRDSPRPALPSSPLPPPPANRLNYHYPRT